MKIEDCQHLDSDHSPILLTISQNIIQNSPSASLTNSRTDWDAFKSILDEVEKFVENIQEAAWRSTPVIKKRVRGKNYPLEIRKLIKEKKNGQEESGSKLGHPKKHSKPANKTA